jgi:NADH dehydrogenase
MWQNRRTLWTALSRHEVRTKRTVATGVSARLIASTIGRRARILHLPVPLAHLATWCVGRRLGDVVLTRDEYRGLMSNLLVSQEPPAGRTSLRAWLTENRDRIGQCYASELSRHYAART